MWPLVATCGSLGGVKYRASCGDKKNKRELVPLLETVKNSEAKSVSEIGGSGLKM